MPRVLLIPMLIALTLFGAFLHYTLPRHDVVLVIDTHERRVDFGANSWFWAAPDAGSAQTGNRDVRFVDAMTPDGGIRVYRNEDTGWGWPPYFKLDSSNLQARAKSLASSQETPIWTIVTKYGWRINVLSIYPNIVAIRAVDSPDHRVFPWLNLTILLSLSAGLALAVLGWMRFYEHRVEPMLDRAVMLRDRLADRRRVWALRLRDAVDRLRRLAGRDRPVD